MTIRAIVIIVAIAFVWGYCVMTMGCALDVMDGSRGIHLEVFMPYEQLPESEKIFQEIEPKPEKTKDQDQDVIDEIMDWVK